MLIPAKAFKPLSILFFVLVGAVLAVAISILWFPKIPSDFSRTNRLLQFLGNETPTNSTLVFGNSIIMDGFDAKLFASKSCNASSYNLSSPGQNQLESLLLISAISKPTKRVVQFYNSTDLESQDFLSHQVIQNFLLFGYQPTDFVLQTLGITNNASSTDLFKQNKVKLGFDSRWLLTNYINTNFRKLLRNDLTLDHISTELYYPRNYTSRFPDEQRIPLIKQFNPQKPKTDFNFNPIKLEVIKRIAEKLSKNNIEYVVVFSPINPDLGNYTDRYLALIDSFALAQKIPNTIFINLSQLLEKDDFVDHFHPSTSGAQKITQELAKTLNECSSKQ
jgi:hypothetical protein